MDALSVLLSSESHVLLEVGLVLAQLRQWKPLQAGSPEPEIS